jgi:hypothetical protein
MQELLRRVRRRFDSEKPVEGVRDNRNAPRAQVSALDAICCLKRLVLVEKRARRNSADIVLAERSTSSTSSVVLLRIHKRLFPLERI